MKNRAMFFSVMLILLVSVLFVEQLQATARQLRDDNGGTLYLPLVMKNIHLHRRSLGWKSIGAGFLRRWTKLLREIFTG